MLGVVELTVVDVDVELMVVDVEVELIVVVVAGVDGAAAGLELERAAAKTASPTKTAAPAPIGPPRLATWRPIPRGACASAPRLRFGRSSVIVRFRCIGRQGRMSHRSVPRRDSRGSRSRASRARKTPFALCSLRQSTVNRSHPRNTSSQPSHPSGFRNQTESRRLANARSARVVQTPWRTATSEVVPGQGGFACSSWGQQRT